MHLLPNAQRNVRTAIETGCQPRVFMPFPVTQPLITPPEIVQPRQLALLNLGAGVEAHSDAVHQAVPTEVQRFDPPSPSCRGVDRTAVRARQPRPAGRPARGRPEADDAQVALSGHVGPRPLHGDVLAAARLPKHRRHRPRATHRAADSAARDMHRKLGNPLSLSSISRHIIVSGHRSAISGDATLGRPPLARLRRTRSSPGAPCGGRAVAGTTGQVPEQPSARELTPG